MIDISKISGDSPLIDEKTKETLKGIFAKLEKDVTIKALVDLNEEKSMEMAVFLKGITGLTPRLSLELYGLEEREAFRDEMKAEGSVMDLEHLPATGLFLDNQYQRTAFHGVPGGKEINSFVIAIYNLAGPGQEISKAAVKKIAKVKRPSDMKICVSLACHHCPGVVISCQRIAMMNPFVQAQMYDGQLYPDLVEQYHIERVPVVIVNDKEIYTGPRSIEDLTQLLLDGK